MFCYLLANFTMILVEKFQWKTCCLKTRCPLCAGRCPFPPGWREASRQVLQAKLLRSCGDGDRGGGGGGGGARTWGVLLRESECKHRCWYYCTVLLQQQTFKNIAEDVAGCSFEVECWICCCSSSLLSVRKTPASLMKILLFYLHDLKLHHILHEP